MEKRSVKRAKTYDANKEDLNYLNSIHKYYALFGLQMSKSEEIHIMKAKLELNRSKITPNMHLRCYNADKGECQ
jgi:deoxyadenosine/deoxycytidine kinase